MINNGSTRSLPLQPERRSTLKSNDDQSAHRRSSDNSDHDLLPGKGNRSMINKGSTNSFPVQPERRKTLNKNDADIEDSSEVDSFAEVKYTGFPVQPLRRATLETTDEAIAQEVEQ
jgi:hypothetical protein